MYQIFDFSLRSKQLFQFKHLDPIFLYYIITKKLVPR